MITSNRPLFALVIASITACVITAVLFKPEYLSQDAAQYLSIAKNIRSGHGNATDVLIYEKHYKPGVIPAPQVTFPPGYPLAIAVLSYTGLTLQQSGLVLSLLCFGAIPLLLYGLMRKTGISAVSAAAFSAIWLLLGISLDIALNTVSELMMITLSLLSALLLHEAMGSVARKRRWMLLAAAGAAAGACFLVRYAAIFYIAALCVFWTLHWLKERNWNPVIDGVALFLLPTLAVAGSFFRNYLLIGDYIGTAQTSTTNPFSEVFQGLYWTLGYLTGFSKTGLVAGHIPELLLLALLPLMAVYLFLNRRHIHVDRPLLKSRLGNPSVIFALVYCVVTMLWLGYLGRTAFSGFSARYMLPIVPFALLCIAALLTCARTRSAAPSHTRYLLPVLLFVLILAGQFNSHRIYWEKRSASPIFLMRSALGDTKFQQVFQRLQKKTGQDTAPLLSNESQRFYLPMRQATLGLTPAAFTQRIWDNKEVFALLCHYRANFVFFFPTLDSAKRPNYIFFHHLAAGKSPAWLKLQYQSPSLKLYTVNRRACKTN